MCVCCFFAASSTFICTTSILRVTSTTLGWQCLIPSDPFRLFLPGRFGLEIYHPLRSSTSGFYFAYAPPCPVPLPSNLFYPTWSSEMPFFLRRSHKTASRLPLPTFPVTHVLSDDPSCCFGTMLPPNSFNKIALRIHQIEINTMIH